MNTLNAIKRNVRHLYETNPRVHINVTVPGAKVRLQNQPAIITNIYPNVFRIQETQNGVSYYHTVQYSELLMKQVEILELS